MVPKSLRVSKASHQPGDTHQVPPSLGDLRALKVLLWIISERAVHGAPGYTARMGKWPWGAPRERPVQGSVLSAQSQAQWTDEWQEPQVLEPGKPSVPSA